MSFLEAKSLLDKSGQLTDPASLLSEDRLGPGGHDDALNSVWGVTDFTAAVAILSKLKPEHLVELSLEETVLDEFVYFRNRLRIHDCCKEFLINTQ